ncbi:MAG: sensor histidine kinase [Verrucomicrobiales bacterium]
MNASLPDFTRNYLIALRGHLKDEVAIKTLSAKELGLQAVTIGLETLDVAKVHEEALIAIVSHRETPGIRETMIRRAGLFFTEVLLPIELTHRGAREGNAHLKVMVGQLTQRTKELAESNRELVSEINQRKVLEDSLRASERQSSQLLERSRQLQEELRLLSRRLIFAQEEERKRISRELHDLIAQTLTGINLQLSILKARTVSDTKEFHQSIEATQRLVEESVDLVHRFARDLRPAVLDDLGLIPALQSYLKSFMDDTGIRVRLTAFADVEKLDNDKRTMLYRVAQEALSNVAQHAKASQTEVSICWRGNSVWMEIHDNGTGFQAGDGVTFGGQSRRLGLLGMRERVEMVGGKFCVESAPGRETTVRVEIPDTDIPSKKLRTGKSAKETPQSS